MQLFKTDLIFLHPPQRKPFSAVRGPRRYGYRHRPATEALSTRSIARCAPASALVSDAIGAMFERAA